MADLVADFVAGDTASKIRVSLTRASDGSVFDLTGYTARLKFRIGTGAVLTKSMDIVAPPTGGVVEYMFASGELTEGTMYAEVEALVSGTVISTTTVGTFIVRGKV